jgi:hypothetical protein
MKPLFILPALILLMAPFAPWPAVGLADWHPNEPGIDEGQTIDVGADKYYPLQLGNTWTYSMSNGTHFMVKVIKHEQLGGMNCVGVACLNENGQTTSYEYMAVTKEGVHRVGSEGNVAIPPILILKQPPQPGQQWGVNSRIGGMALRGTFRCGKKDRLKVGDKFYDVIYTECDDLNANGRKFRSTIYYARDVGMVKQTLTYGTQHVVIELEKFEPGQVSW